MPIAGLSHFTWSDAQILALPTRTASIEDRKNERRARKQTAIGRDKRTRMDRGIGSLVTNSVGRRKIKEMEGLKEKKRYNGTLTKDHP